MPGQITLEGLLRTPLQVEGRLTQAWAEFFVGLATLPAGIEDLTRLLAVTLTQSDEDAVLGRNNLTNAGAIPKVSEAGTVDESAVTDNGASLILVTGRGIVIDNNYGFDSKDSAGTARALLTLDGANPDVLHLRNNQRGVGGAISFDTQAGGAAGATLDSAGNLNVIGGYKANSATGLTSNRTVVYAVVPVTTTLQYQNWANANVSMTVQTGTSVSTTTHGFTGGILTT